MRAVLLNDTRSEEHVGCTLVMENILKQCQRVGIQIVHHITNAECQEAAAQWSKSPQHDLLLINGEGTMHHGRPAALQICAAARDAKASGKKIVLLNTVWEDNAELKQYLPAFDLIFGRESLSTQELIDHGASAETVPDMIFDTQIEGRFCDQPGQRIKIIDSIRSSTSRQLLRLAITHKLTFLVMDRVGHRRIRRFWLDRWRLYFRTGQGIATCGTERFISEIAEAKALISGRFHGTCLGFILGKPVLSVASNTRKIEGLYKDIGLPIAAVATSLDHDFIELQKNSLTPVAESLHLVRKYVAQAPKKIAQMFDRIAGLG